MARSGRRWPTAPPRSRDSVEGCVAVKLSSVESIVIEEDFRWVFQIEI